MRPFALVGMITHHFEQCECHLSELFQLLCEAENPGPFRAAGLIISSNLRLGMTRAALEACMPKPSTMKGQVDAVLVKFEEQQTLRNRAIHQSFFTEFTPGGRIEMLGRPLWHQTLRYASGELKPNLEQSVEILDNLAFELTGLTFEMRAVLNDLSAFLETRRRRRLRRGSLGKGGRADAS